MISFSTYYIRLPTISILFWFASSSICTRRVEVLDLLDLIRLRFLTEGVPRLGNLVKSPRFLPLKRGCEGVRSLIAIRLVKGVGREKKIFSGFQAAVNNFLVKGCGTLTEGPCRKILEAAFL